MSYLIFFDTETTGKRPEDRIIQIGAVIVSAEGTTEIYDELCRAPVPIGIEAMEIHHITPEQIEEAPPFDTTGFAARLRELNSPENFLIAHHISFDLAMLAKEGFENRCRPIDTLRCSQHLFDRLASHRLQYLRYALELYRNEPEETRRLSVQIRAHDALGDAVVVKLLFDRLVRRCRGRFPHVPATEQLHELSGRPVMLDSLLFGKYKGCRLSEIARQDPAYLHWMRRTLELDENMRHSLDHYIGVE